MHHNAQNAISLATTHPKLHAHPFNDKYAITYVSSDDLKSSKLDPELIIGWSSDKDKLDPKTFVENRKFSNFLTSVLKENVHKVNDSNLKAMADWQKEGWLHIGDERNPAPWGRINFPEDIIGSVEINAGVIKEGSYQAMPTHRLMTNNGIFQLSEPLTNLVIEEAKKKASNAK
ncbi:hypothetical protein MFLAVUS_007335 [Mucor flavus]|uniref:Uncharacterized protein n=1 Tax=Mucor flavus TaxID=439312 RepID=A0ABP9Z419_9FUNG